MLYEISDVCVEKYSRNRMTVIFLVLCLDFPDFFEVSRYETLEPTSGNYFLKCGVDPFDQVNG
jgi:hypothetical protein